MNNSYITYNNKKIYFELKLKSNRSNSITLKVKPEGNVIISVPTAVTKSHVLDIVNKRADWIYKKIEEFKSKQNQIPKFKYISGEEHYYLGNKYQLNIIDKSYLNSSSKIKGNNIFIYGNDIDSIKKNLKEFYSNQALDVFSDRFNEALIKTYWVKNRPNLVLKFMKSQWGSCSSTNKICLNIHLIKTPIECIDYVIYHELCHVLVKNHSKKFYELLEQVCPNWKEWRKYLRTQSDLVS